MSEEKCPCDEALSAIPGDRIHFKDEGGKHEALVRACIWKEAPKGGKIYTYETIDGAFVSNEQVFKVEKLALRKTIEEVKEVFKPTMDFQVQLMREIRMMVSNLEISDSLKVAIGCILDGDAANLEVAAFLLNKRVEELLELKKASNSPLVK